MNETQNSTFLALVAKIAHGTSTKKREERLTLSARFNKSANLYQTSLIYTIQPSKFRIHRAERRHLFS